MIPVIIYDRGGMRLETVFLLKPDGDWPRAIAWGHRTFVVESDGRYVETYVPQALTRSELQVSGMDHLIVGR